MVGFLNTNNQPPITMIAQTPFDTDHLPSTPGVYFFYGKSDAPVYIGKSINIRKRVLSHIYDAKHDAKEHKIIRATTYVRCTQTPGELSALILESLKIKEHRPIFNRRLRRSRHTFAWQLVAEGDWLTPKLSEATWPPSAASTEFGLYRSKTHAQQHLTQLAEAHQLCKKRLGLEKTQRACFGYQLKKCVGSCIGKESPEHYNQRLKEAIHDHAIKVWPYSGAIGIIESESPEVVNIIDQWHFMGTADRHHLNEIATFQQPILDRDTYRIIAGYLFNPNKRIEILDLDTSIDLLDSDASA